MYLLGRENVAPGSSRKSARSYAVGEDKLLVVQTDRLSAFDVICPIRSG